MIQTLFFTKNPLEDLPDIFRPWDDETEEFWDDE